MKTLSESIIGRKGTYLGGTPVVFWNQYDPADISVVLDMPSDVIDTIEHSDENDFTIPLDRRDLDDIYILYMSDEPSNVACLSTGCRTLEELRDKFKRAYNMINATIHDIYKYPYRYEIHIGDAYIPIGSILEPEIPFAKSQDPRKPIQDMFDSEAAWNAWIEFIWNMPDATSTSGVCSYGYDMLDIKHKKVIERPRGSSISVKIETFKEFGKHNERYGN